MAVIENVESSTVVTGTSSADTITNSGIMVSIDGAKGNDFIENEGYSTTIHGGKGNDTISLKVTGNLIEYASGDGNDTILGFNESDTLSISADTYSTKTSGSDVIVKVGKNKIRLVGAKGKALNINETKTPEVITLTEGDDTLTNYFDNVSINALGGKDSLRNFLGNKVTIEAGAGNDYIFNSEYGSESFISGGAGNDTLYNSAYSATLDGGEGKDTIYNGEEAMFVEITGGAGNNHIYNLGMGSIVEAGKGNDTISNSGAYSIFNYTEGDGKDKIFGFDETSTLNIAGSKYSSKKSGDNIIFTVGSGKITLFGAASLSAVNVNFANLLLVDDETASPVTVDSKTQIIDASTRTKAVKIKGNKLDNQIIGSNGKDTLYGGSGNDILQGGVGKDKLYGQNGDDTLSGGAGDDSLWGGAGEDTFIYTTNEGKDTIYDWESGDMLQILNSDGSQGSFTNSSFKNSNLTLTIDGGGKVVFSGVSKSDTFNINGTSYSISGSKLRG